MTKKELIEALAEFDDDEIVYIECYDEQIERYGTIELSYIQKRYGDGGLLLG